MEIFGISSVVNIIVDYAHNDVYCRSVLEMKWDKRLISELRISYLSHIFNNHPDKVDTNILASNPELTPDLVKQLKDLVTFKTNPIYYLNNEVNYISSTNCGVYISWLHPALPYEQLVNDNKYHINWKQLGFNTSLSYEFLKTNISKFDIGSVSQHLNAGDLLIDIIRSKDPIFVFQALRNPSLPFDKMSDLEWNEITDDPMKSLSLVHNPNLPIDFFKKYIYIMNHLGTAYRYNRNIRQLLKVFPLQMYAMDNLLLNPTSYGYCVEEEVRKYLNNISDTSNTTDILFRCISKLG